jgi:hypothetical protein
MERLAQVGPVERHGWCELVDKATTKKETDVPLAQRQGYIQLSFDGLNHVGPTLRACCFRDKRPFLCIKVVLLHHLVAVATTRSIPNHGQEASHLCHNSVCKSVGHVIWEDAVENQRRKGCVVWVSCSHDDCEKVVLACPHEPKCIKTIPGVTEAEYLASPLVYRH